MYVCNGMYGHEVLLLHEINMDYNKLHWHGYIASGPPLGGRADVNSGRP